jgi:hypothetical protein
LTDLEHRLWELVEVTASDNEDFSIGQAYLNRLEIMREVRWRLDYVSGYTLCLGIVDEESLRVFLDNVHHQICNDCLHLRRGTGLSLDQC